MRNSATSLRATLLRYLLLTLLPTLLVGTGLAYYVSVHRVRDVFDMNLLDIGLDLAREVQLRDGRLVLELPQATDAMLRTANKDRISYALWNPQQGLIGGDKDLLDIAPAAPTQHYRFATEMFHGRNQRTVKLQTEREGRPLYITVAQTTGALNGIQRSIFASVLLLGSLLTVVALGGVFIGVRRGLKPIAALSAAINTRSPANLSPLPTPHAPDELRPIVDNINSLLEQLAQSLHAHRHFIADAAHQLRTPLATLNAQLEVALKIPPADPRATFEQLLETTQRAGHLANQLLSLARLEHTEQIPPTAEALSLDEILSAVLPGSVLAAEAKAIELNFDMQPCRIFGNRILLEELFSNLLDNAIRYVQDGGQVVMHSAVSGKRARITLADNGPGIAPENLDKLGTPFFRADTGNHNGCGLGLAIAREIVRLHQGSLHFSRASEAGGLRIDIELPAL